MNIEQHIEDYRYKLFNGLGAINGVTLQKIVDTLTNAFNARAHVFVCGNGGSAAISEHFTCDHGKGISSNTCFFPKMISLSSNVSTLTAYANDIGYDKVFSEQLINLADSGDVLIAISSSGNSPNIVEAIKTALQLGMTVITFTGFDGGSAKDLAHFNIHIPIYNYGIVEDCHQAVMHILAQYIRKAHTVVDIDKVKL